jgi:hypothetical protein
MLKCIRNLCKVVDLHKIRSFLEIRCSHSVASLYSLYLLFFGALRARGDAGGWVTEMHRVGHGEPRRDGKVGNKKRLCEALGKDSVRLSVKSVCASGDAGGWDTEMHRVGHREPQREGKVGNKKWLCEALSKNSVRLSVKSVCSSGDAGGWDTEMHRVGHREPRREGKVGNKKWLCEAM